MKQFTAVVSHDAGLISKYQDFDTQAEADAHVVTFGGKVVQDLDDDLPYWDVTNTAVKDTVKQAADLKAVADTQYQRDRAIAYGPTGDQLDMQYHDLVNGTTTFKDHIAAVKLAHPKAGD